MTHAHPNISVVDPALTKQDVANLYSPQHAELWDMVRSMGEAVKMRPPIFEVVALLATAGSRVLQGRARTDVERGWLAHDPVAESTLAGEIPEVVPALEALACTEGLRVTSAEIVAARDCESAGVSPADLVRAMKEEGIGRPSTYARHVSSMDEYARAGLLVVDGRGRFRISQAGRELLDVLADSDLPRLDRAYCAQLEADLDAIERGAMEPMSVRAHHLSRLLSGESESAAGGSAVHGGSSVESAWSVAEYVLPIHLDPAQALEAGHMFRTVCRMFDNAISDACGCAEASRREISVRRACRAAALARIMGSSNDMMLERLRFDLGWRWVVGLAPTDAIWSAEVYEGLLADGIDLVDRLCASVSLPSRPNGSELRP